jgi:hypothetical protein
MVGKSLRQKRLMKAYLEADVNDDGDDDFTFSELMELPARQWDRNAVNNSTPERQISGHREVYKPPLGVHNLHSASAEEGKGTGYILKSLVAELSVRTAPVCC